MTKRNTSDDLGLGRFDGRQVIATTIAVKNAGDGLSKALATEPVILHHEEVVNVVMECVVSAVSFEPSKDNPELLIRKHTLSAGVATIIDNDVVRQIIAAQREKNLLADEAAKGIDRLPGVTPEP